MVFNGTFAIWDFEWLNSMTKIDSDTAAAVCELWSHMCHRTGFEWETSYVFRNEWICLHCNFYLITNKQNIANWPVPGVIGASIAQANTQAEKRSHTHTFIPKYTFLILIVWFHFFLAHWIDLKEEERHLCISLCFSWFVHCVTLIWLFVIFLGFCFA